MSKPAKIYTFFMCLALIFLLGTEIQPVKSQRKQSRYSSNWLSITGKKLEIKLKGVSSGIPIGKELEHLPGLDNLKQLSFDEPVAIKGVYVTSWMAGSPKFMNQLVEFINKTEVNAVVIDVKDDSGRISYNSLAQLGKSIGAAYPKYNPGKIIKLLNENQIYPIARIVTFKDPFLANARPDLAVKNKSGGIWRDFQGLAWVDPHNKTVWDYNVAVAKEAAGLGFREIQFDYVRFTSDGILKDCLYPAADGRSKSDVIRDFLKYASAELKPLGVKVSADVFGLTCSVKDDLGIGQILEKIADGVDIICPMVYPSHYYRGQYSLPDPDKAPYETVYRSLTDAKHRLEQAGKSATIRPWLQDFSLRNYYGREQLLAQINAVHAAGYQEWIFWNPSNRYVLSKYRLEGEAEVAPKVAPVLIPPVNLEKPMIVQPQPQPEPVLSEEKN